MSALFCFGLSYTASAYISGFGAQFEHIAGTTRTAEKSRSLRDHGIGGHPVEAFEFNDSGIAQALASATLLLISIPPGAQGDLVLETHADAIRHAASLRSIVYLSTIGVYGNHDGEWIDETTPANPTSPRSRERAQAESQWQQFGRDTGVPVAIFRLPGIYGPGRNALINVTRGEARRIVKPGQVFNRIHVSDIARAIDAAYSRQANGIFNICDDEPTPGQDPVAYAAQLLGRTLPPEQQFEDIKDAMSPMARSFYAESKRVRNALMKRDLGVVLDYPTYREGLRALHASGDA